MKKPSPSDDIRTAFKEALTLHQQGYLHEAARRYEWILARESAHFDALHLLGVVAYQLGNPVVAVDLISQSVGVDPTVARAYSNRGIALHELGRLEDALADYNKAIELKPDYAEALNNRCLVLRELCRLEEALASCDRAIALNANYVEAYNNRGALLLELSRIDEALTSIDKALALRAEFAEAHVNRGNALRKLKRIDESLASYEQAIKLKPDYAEAYNNRGIARQEINHLAEALADFDQAIKLNSNHPELYSNRSVVLQKLKRLDEAVASANQAIALKADYAEAHNNLGAVLQDLRRIDEALNSFDRALALKADYAEAHWNKSLLLLLVGNLMQGWSLYEWRWRKERLTSPKRSFSKPLWPGDVDLRGKTILLHAEQGLGDTLHFCRYASLVKDLAARVVLEVPSTLFEVLRGLEGVDVLIKQGDPIPAFDFHCPLLSLPLAFKTELTSIPSKPAYIASSTDLRNIWSQRLGPRRKVRVGLAWSGSRAYISDHYRSMKLADLLPHLPDECDYYCIQKDVRDEDRDALLRSRINFYGDELTFPHAAALIDLMDVVVSTDTSIPHLSGALGKPTWLMLAFVPDWRWMLDRSDSPWYPSMKLYRQGEDRSWAKVLRKIHEDLIELSTGWSTSGQLTNTR